MLAQLRLYIFSYFIQFLPRSRAFGVKRWLGQRAGIKVASGVRLYSSVRFETGNIFIGKSTWVGPAVRFMAGPHARITIGQNCDIAPECLFVTGSHQIGTSSRRAGLGHSLPITVGDGTWIGARVTVLGGVNVGKGCVIAAGAVVTKDIPDNVLAGGIPARVIRKLSL